MLLDYLLSLCVLEDGTEIHLRGVSNQGLSTQSSRMGERRLLETVLPVDGIPDHPGRVSGVTGEPFRVMDQAHIVTLRAHALIVGNTVISLVAFVIVLDHTALPNILAKKTL